MHFGSPLRPEESYVERLWNDLAGLEQYLHPAEPTVLINTRSAFTKAMILAAGNWLERRTLQALEDFAGSASSRETLVWFVKRRGLGRQFHTLFDWESGKVSSFVANFGPDFKKQYEEAASSDTEVLRASLDFMELVAERNELAHSSRISDEAQFTAAEVREKFYSAAGWVTWVGGFLREGGAPSWNPPSVPTT